MKKMVVLTEGQTEQIFIAELLLHIAAAAPLKIDAKRLWGGKKFETYELEISAKSNTDSDPDFYVLILDCASDGRVISALKERYAGFIAQDFEKILVVRDVRPDFTFSEIEKARADLSGQLPVSPVLPILILATMEVETWFIRELSHFARIDPSLDEDQLRSFGIDEEMEFEKIDLPAKKMREIYSSVGISYGKSRADVERAVQSLDKGRYLSSMTDKIPSIKPMIESANAFLASGA